MGFMILILVSTGHFDPLIQACDKISSRFDFFGQIGMSYTEPSFPFVRTAPPAEIQRLIQEAEMVISHGGTGMLSQLYQFRKPTIIVPKQIRYGEANDSQVELAVKWAELGMGILCLDVNNIENAIQECRKTQLQFPQFPKLGRFLSPSL
jgi:UDP-N-acetylglucosamine transferase subunit ALG13